MSTNSLRAAFSLLNWFDDGRLTRAESAPVHGAGDWRGSRASRPWRETHACSRALCGCAPCATGHPRCQGFGRAVVGCVLIFLAWRSECLVCSLVFPVKRFSQTRSELGLPNRGGARGRGRPRWGSVLGLTTVLGSAGHPSRERWCRVTTVLGSAERSGCFRSLGNSPHGGRSHA